MKIEINEKYEGYIWMSDRQTPDVKYDQSIILDLDEQQNPFIIEGHLCVKEKMSYSIKYVDGKYLVQKHNLASLPEGWIKGNTKEYIPNRLKIDTTVINKICFDQYWLPDEDEFCMDMEVLIPAALVFTGFK